MLRRIFYVSEISPYTTPTTIQAIVAASMIWNRRHDVTGLLVASRLNFAQVLEGRAESMAAVMERIRRDRHHHAIKVKADVGITQRMFGRWSMACLLRDDLSDQLRRLHLSDDLALRDATLQELAAAGSDLAADL